jgi:hypothetical protein
LEGEKKHGRFIFLKEKKEGLTLTFIRFINQVYKNKQKLIGFEITGKKNEIHRIML